MGNLSIVFVVVVVDEVIEGEKEKESRNPARQRLLPHQVTLWPCTSLHYMYFLDPFTNNTSFTSSLLSALRSLQTFFNPIGPYSQSTANDTSQGSCYGTVITRTILWGTEFLLGQTTCSSRQQHPHVNHEPHNINEHVHHPLVPPLPISTPIHHSQHTTGSHRFCCSYWILVCCS